MHTSFRRYSKLFTHLILLCFLVPLLTSCESKKTIVNSLSEREANEIIVFLSTRGLDPQKIQSTDGGGAGGANKEILWNITVPEPQAIHAMSLLNQSGLPRRRGQSLLTIFKDVGLVPSELQQQIRYQAGLAEQLASTIRKIDGVLDAEVQISFPKEDPLNPEKTKDKITASVYIKHSGVLDDPNTQLTTKIKRLVTAAITGLDYDNVTIIPERSRYSDLPLGGFEKDDEKEYLKVWGLIIAKESASHFRIIFFVLILLVLFLVLLISWFSWKVSPLLGEHGGVKSLFRLTPIKKGKEEPAAEEEEEDETEEEEEEGEEEDEDEEDEDEEDEEDEDQETKDVT